MHDRRELLRDLVDFTIDVATGDRILGLPFSRQKEGIDKAVWLANQMIEYLDSGLQSSLGDSSSASPDWLRAMQRELNLSPSSYPMAQVGIVLGAAVWDAAQVRWCKAVGERCESATESLCMVAALYRESSDKHRASPPHSCVCGAAINSAVKRVVAAVCNPSVALSVANAQRVPLWLLEGPLLVLLRSELDSEMLTACADQIEHSHQSVRKRSWVQWNELLHARLRKRELFSQAAAPAPDRERMQQRLELLAGCEIANLEWAAKALIARQGQAAF